MNVLRAIKVAELRKKLAIIPGKIILALLLLIAILLYRNKTWDLMVLWNVIKTDWIYYLGALVFIYGTISYFTFFFQLIKQWFLGLIASVGIVVALYFTIANRYSDIFVIVIFVLIMIGPLFDIIHFFRYIRLKNMVIEAEEEMKNSIANGGHDSAYDDGFEEGYRRGVNAGKREGISSKGRHKQEGRNQEGIDSDDYYAELEAEDGDYDSYGDESGRNSEDWDAEEDAQDWENNYDSGKYNSGKYDSDKYDSDEYDSENQKGASSTRTVEADSQNVEGYFADCHNRREVKRRYHDLCRVYHPDSGNVSSDIFCRIHAEYMKRMAEYEE